MQFKDPINTDVYIGRSCRLVKHALAVVLLLAWVGSTPLADVSITQLAN